MSRRHQVRQVLDGPKPSIDIMLAVSQAPPQQTTTSMQVPAAGALSCGWDATDH